jgi:hypothetical protein
MVEACQLLVLQALNTVLFRLVLFRVLWCASRTLNELRWEQKLIFYQFWGLYSLYILPNIFPYRMLPRA